MNRLWTALRVGLGLIFVLASLEKIVHPELFARIVDNYRILPATLVNPVALLLPWVEAVCGLALACGVLARGAALVLAGLMAAFLAALGGNLVRGLDVACGCFTVDPLAAPSVRWYLLRDALLLLLSWAVLWRVLRPAGRDRS